MLECCRLSERLHVDREGVEARDVPVTLSVGSLQTLDYKLRAIDDLARDRCAFNEFIVQPKELIVRLSGRSPATSFLVDVTNRGEPWI